MNKKIRYFKLYNNLTYYGSQISSRQMPHTSCYSEAFLIIIYIKELEFKYLILKDTCQVNSEGTKREHQLRQTTWLICSRDIFSKYNTNSSTRLLVFLFYIRLFSIWLIKLNCIEKIIIIRLNVWQGNIELDSVHFVELGDQSKSIPGICLSRSVLICWAAINCNSPIELKYTCVQILVIES